jgi:hypothetical protein
MNIIIAFTRPIRSLSLLLFVAALGSFALSAEDEGCGSWNLYDKKVTVSEKESLCVQRMEAVETLLCEVNLLLR